MGEPSARIISQFLVLFYAPLLSCCFFPSFWCPLDQKLMQRKENIKNIRRLIHYSSHQPTSTTMRSSAQALRGSATQNLDFDEEARKLWERLNLDPESRTGGQWNPTDPIWRHPTGGGTIYVGNQTAAENLPFLQSLGITRVVNCTTGASRIPNFHEGRGLLYYTFSISSWSTSVNSTGASVLAFANPMFSFIEAAISKGESVLVHCLAGAHRAGDR